MTSENYIENALEKNGLVSNFAPQELSGRKTFDPRTDQPIEIIKLYHEQECVKCSCGKNKRHKSGIVVKFNNGSLGLMGLNCARKDFGDQIVNNLETGFALKKRTSINKSLIEPTLKRIHDGCLFISANTNNAKQKDQFFKAINTYERDIYQKLLTSSNQDHGRWTIDTIVKRRAIDKNGQEKIIRDIEKSTVFVIDGHKAISMNASSLLESARKWLDRSSDLIRIEPYENKNIETSIRYLREAEQRLNNVEEQMEAAKKFFTPVNLKAIEQATQKNKLLGNMVITKRKIRLDSYDWGKQFEYIDIPYSLADLNDEGKKSA